ncbi:hypothetical protein [Roseobacter weihaiensis]|nr:hypothetical protein [Roseobacter sp. H9]
MGIQTTALPVTASGWHLGGMPLRQRMTPAPPAPSSQAGDNPERA